MAEDAHDTCWTLVRAAARGTADARDELARRYLAPVRAYLAARWRATPLRAEVDDAVQEVFVECFRAGGLLARADPERGGFRAFLYGAARVVALRTEERREREQRARGTLASEAASEERLSRIFDRSWARSLVARAARRLEESARARGERAVRRAEILRLRFGEDLPVRAIAERLGLDPAEAHHEYARARREFRAALRDVVAFEHPGTPGELERECERLLDLLG